LRRRKAWDRCPYHIDRREIRPKPEQPCPSIGIQTDKAAVADPARQPGAALRDFGSLLLDLSLPANEREFILKKIGCPQISGSCYHATEVSLGCCRGPDKFGKVAGIAWNIRRVS
jgi:hypothetical protein